MKIIEYNIRMIIVLNDSGFIFIVEVFYIAYFDQTLLYLLSLLSEVGLHNMCNHSHLHLHVI